MVTFDAVVVGAGPNGLAAAVELTRAGRRVLVVEQADSIGGGTRTSELTLPGFRHDVCSAIHPMALASPFFRDLDLDVDWIQPPIAMTHPVGDGRVGLLFHELDRTCAGLAQDGDRWRQVFGPLVTRADEIVADYLAPMPLWPTHPAAFLRMAVPGVLPASVLAAMFATPEAKGLIAGLAAHSIAALSAPMTAGVAQLFALTAHRWGWPLVRGGSQGIAEAMARLVIDGGGQVETGQMVASLDDLPPAATVILDVMPAAAARLAGDRITARRRRELARHHHGPGVFKVDWALDGPIPWADEWSPKAGTVHVGGTFAEVVHAEAQVQSGRHPARPFVLVAQQSLFDDTRAPAGGQTGWGYCHVPYGSDVDMTDPIETQIERFAPGFRDRIIGRHVMGPGALEAHNPNTVGGDIAGGSFGPRKIFQFQFAHPYRLADGLWLCSSATPPGAGVHGMCGWHAARAALAAVDSEAG